MNLSQIIQNVSIPYPFKIILMTLVLITSTPFLLLLIVLYKRITDHFCSLRLRLSINTLKDYFSETLMKKGNEKTSFFLKYYILIQILAVLYIVFYPVNSENAFTVFFVYGTVNLLMYALDYLSEESSHIQYQSGKKIRQIFEYFFLILITLIFIRILNEVPDKPEYIRYIKILLGIVNKIILFTVLFLIRESLSVDLYKIRKRWVSRFSQSGELIFRIADQLTGVFLIFFFMIVSFSQDSWFIQAVRSSISSHSFPLFKWVAGSVFFVIADNIQRLFLVYLPMPEERYLIKLNNLIFLPSVIISILIIVSFK